MKRLVAFIMVFLMITGLAACKSNKAEQVESEEPIDYEEQAGNEEQAESNQEAEESSGKLVGGWEISDVGEAELPESVKSAFEKATESLTGNDLVPVAYIGQQVVAGKNHMILCRSTPVTQDPVSKYQVIVIYEDLEGNAEISSFTDFDIASFTDGEGAENAGETLEGGWYVPEDYTSNELPAEAKAAYDKAMEVFTGTVVVAPMTLLGTQVVAGTNYAVLCHTAMGTPDAAGSIAVLTIYEDLDGNAEVTNMCTLDLMNLSQQLLPKDAILEDSTVSD